MFSGLELEQFSYLCFSSNKFALQRHKFLLRSVLRTLALRNIAMATLTQMRMSRKIVIVQELKEQHALEKCKWHLQDEEQWQTQKEMVIADVTVQCPVKLQIVRSPYIISGRTSAGYSHGHGDCHPLRLPLGVISSVSSYSAIKNIVMYIIYHLSTLGLL